LPEPLGGDIKVPFEAAVFSRRAAGRFRLAEVVLRSHKSEHLSRARILGGERRVVPFVEFLVSRRAVQNGLFREFLQLPIRLSLVHRQ